MSGTKDNKRVSLFGAAAVHDCKNLVVAIRAAYEQLGTSAELIANNRSAFVSIDFASSALLDILSEILAVDSDQDEMSECALGDLMGDAVNSMLASAEAKGLTIHSYFDCVGFSFLVAKHRVTRALLNLIDNAIKYSVRGSILVTAKVNNERLQPGKQCFISFSVSDTGNGISAQDLKQINQGSIRSGTVTKKTGEGIGLSGTRHWLERVGGSVTAGNRADRGGGFFSFSLPCVVGAQLTAECSDVVDVMLASSDDVLCKAVEATLPAGVWLGMVQNDSLESTDSYFDGNARTDSVKVLLVDMASGFGEKILSNSTARRSSLQKTICIALTRTIKPVSSEEWAAAGFNSTVNVHMLNADLLPTVVQQVVYAQRAAKPAVVGIRRSSVLAGLKLLIVDDNAGNLCFCEALATSAGAECITACNGLDAAGILKSQEAGYFDMVLLDCYLPDLNGCDVIRRTRQQLVGSQVVLMSADDVNVDMLEGIESVVNQILKKPITAASFIAAVKGLTMDEATTIDHPVRCSDALTALVLDIKIGFRNSLTQSVRQINALLEAGDDEALWSVTHQLKSSALQSGYMAFAALCTFDNGRELSLLSEQEKEGWFSAFCKEADSILFSDVS